MSANENGAVRQLSNIALIESMLFVASGPVAISRFAKVLGITPRATQKLLTELEEQYADRGFQLQYKDNQVQLTTAPEASGIIEEFLGLEATTKLSPAALEVLAIIAYLQPITRPQVDNIRGVNSDGALRSLLSKGLIEEVGRLDTPGRPILYGSTPEFLQHFGLSMIEELPPIGDEEE
ncbi:MAG: SMC-Scp complex subunit ScpB [Chloroflexota bacterium]